MSVWQTFYFKTVANISHINELTKQDTMWIILHFWAMLFQWGVNDEDKKKRLTELSYGYAQAEKIVPFQLINMAQF